MKKVKLSKLQLNDMLSKSEKKRIVGGLSAGISVQCLCRDEGPVWYAGCYCPNPSCEVISELPEECIELF